MTNFQIKSKNNINYNYTNFVSKYDYWIFDLDNTLYDINLGLFRRISKRMTEYIKEFFDLEHDKALSLQKNMYKKYGLTLRGLMIEKNMDPEPYLKYVHDVDFDDLKIDNELKNLLKKLKGNKFIYTNASYDHAKNILQAMGIFEEFEMIFDIKDSNYIAKPDYKSYDMMISKFGINNKSIKRSIFFEDTAKNLKPASELDITTVWVDNEFNKEDAEIHKQYIDFTGSDIKTILNDMTKN
jgi:putative hydrolase of the HAD superfamily|tara:strand:- start:1232 stop:1951 length:720 start_codon:yes stop_codon:yes gene_type:complete